jgi:hypothetical protein
VIAYSLPPLIEMLVYYYVDGLRWLTNNDEHDYYDVVFTSQLCLFT